MPLAVCVIGHADVPHCSGMTRAGGSGFFFVDGVGVSRQGDNNTPHLRPPNIPPCPGHSAPIATGSTFFFVEGRGCGRIGDAISDCTSVAEGSGFFFAD